ncbi:hypothetical protein EOK75_14870 (plasmid) [Pseudorhodobacter turbinis]|uniref:MobA-like NTP transferase domain-containing protein n=1 Tax=Pseudorhodobacter turbinis TaxID=2500533 RepID=A0A4P8EJ96_9RHOB|nr:NTP transferase domain-containing protein [Pseudorhodobacter turbinis]QCO57067.1 hypothetical protein EOK75_14870 [Pseudorhodobacter turbinis]
MTKGTAVPPVSILVLAAGASARRRGTDKLLESVAGQPLLRRVVHLAPVRPFWSPRLIETPHVKQP